MKHKVETHYQACNLCEAICGLEIQTRGPDIVSIKGDKNDPLSLGHICPKAIALQDIYKDPERLRLPVRKSAQGWETISWEEAFSEVVLALRAIQKRYGKDAVSIYQGNPTVHSLGIMMYANSFFKQLRTRNRYSATSLDQLPHHITAGLMFGHEMLVPVPDIDRTQFMLILGANPIVSNGSMMTAPNVGKRLKALKVRGGSFWVVDPRLSETAALADEHVFIKPGTDAHLLAAMISTVFAENWQRETKLAGILDGLGELRTLLADWTPERVAPVTGISAETIRRMVATFCEADSAVLYGRMGVSTQEFGSVCQWLMVVFNIITGNFDAPGGAMFSTPAIDTITNRALKSQGKKPVFSFDSYRSRVKSLPEMQGELPVTTLLDEIETEGEGQIKAMVVVAGNPVLSTPNGQRLSHALEGLDFIVAVDCYINETSRHANIILPPATILERDHYDLAFHALAVRNTARFSRAIFKADKNSFSDADIFLELAARMQSERGKVKFLKRFRLNRYKRSGLRAWLDKALKSGPYGIEHSLTLNKLIESKHGLDFGPLRSRLPARLFTPNKRIDLTPAKIVADLPRLQSQLNNTTKDETELSTNMLLIGRRDPRTCNSWLHNSARMTKGKERCLAHIHPLDVKRLGLVEGRSIRVLSLAGTVEIEFDATETIKPGVISIPHGWGHNLPGVKMRCAVAHAGVSVNDLTRNDFYDAVSGNAALNGVPVKVESVLP